MGYTVRYAPSKPKQYQKPFPFWLPMALCLSVLSVIGACRQWPSEMSKLNEALFPWTSEYVQKAVSGIEDDLRAGESMGTALEAFCREILVAEN